MFIDAALLFIALVTLLRVQNLKSHIEDLDAELDGLYEELTGDEIVEGDLFVTGCVISGGDITFLQGEEAVRKAANQTG